MVLQISPSPLTQSLSLPFSGKVAPNRLVKAAMTERLCRDSADRDQLGRPSPELSRLYEEWSHGDYGLIVTGNILVDRNHLEAKGNAVIDKDAPFHFEEDYAHLATIAKGRASLVIAQLNHPGGQCSKNLQENPVAPSDIQCPPALGAEFNKPTSLTDAGVLDIIDRFVFAAGVLYRAGFDGVQLHAAHGYLLTQFLSPRTNKRTDRWGGDLEGRSRIIFEIVEGIQRVTAPEFSISVKLNSQDYISDGFTTTDCQELIVGLEKARVDFIELSGGTYESLTDAFQYKSESTRKREAFFIDFAETVQAQVKETKILVTGGFRHRASMEDAVASGAADLVGLARTLTAEPRIGRSLLSRQVDGCRANLLPDHIGLGIAASNIQILDIGFGREPTDYAKVENVNAFLKALGLA